VLTQGHDGAADLWAFGVILYELMCGQTPFSGRNQQRTFEKIVHSQKHLQFPQVFDSHGKSLIRRLLHPNASLRIGCLQNGFKDVKEHAFFLIQNLDFDLLASKSISPSFRPTEELMCSQGSGDTYPEFNIPEELRALPVDEYEHFFEGLSNSSLMADD
jgi:serine/threonine protein kinase